MTTSQYLRVVICLNLIMVTMALPTRASACSCSAPGLPAQEFQESNAVFTGKVLRIVDEYVPLFSTLDRILTAIGRQPYFWLQAGKYVGYRIHFRIHKSWKGVESTSVTVDTGYGMGDCGYPFTVNNDYLVYAAFPYGIPNEYWVTSICSRTMEISTAADDLTYLNAFATLPLTSSIRIMGLPFSAIAVWLLFLMITIVIFLYTHKLRMFR